MVNWVVALEEGLEDIEKYLREKGIHIVSLEDEQSPVDAIVYKGRSISEIQLDHLNNVSNSIDNYNGENSFGVLLVNAQNKTPQQVYEIIKNRAYEHLI